MRILIADDHAVFRRGLKEILAERYPGAAFGEAESSQAALEQVWKAAWDVMVLDITMPGRSGVEILKEIKHAQPNLPVLMLSVHPEEQYAVRVLEAGAAGYLTKLQAPHELVEAIKQVLAGGQYISPRIAEQLVDRLREGEQRPPHERLSNREFEILKLIAVGKSMKDIAHELSVSPQTVSTHRARILKKMGLLTTAALVRYAVENKLVV
jgi:DNA-binding NarL/FixJ family response regulator